MSQTRTKLSRRNFLLAVGAGGAASAVAVVANKPQTQAPVSGTGKRETRGYAVSEHINNYYRTTKV